MRRIATILLLYVLLASAPHFGQQPPLPQLVMGLRAQALPLPPEAVRRDYGALKLEALWRLSASSRAFGGLSGLLVESGGRFRAITDSGEQLEFALPENGAGVAWITGLPRLPGERMVPRRMQDSESMALDPATGRLWVGFEATQRICRYGPAFEWIERCASAEAMQAWPVQGGAEALVRLPDGRFIAFGERAPAPGGGYEALLWAGDPAETGAAPPLRLAYRAPTGYRPTDAISLGGDRLLVLNRRFTLAEGFTARLALVRLPAPGAGGVLRGETVAAFQYPGPTDNLEALALEKGPGGPKLWVAADDNHFFLQRTLLFRFALPGEWMRDTATP